VDLRLLEHQAVALFLHVVRAGGFFVAVPLFGRQRDTAFLRLMLSLSMGCVFWWVSRGNVPAPSGVLMFGTFAVREAFVGLVIGFAIGLMLQFLVASGEIIANEMGFAMARSMNPESGIDSSVMSQLFQLIGFLLILHYDLHHDALRVLEETYRACPVGASFDLEPVYNGLRVLITGSIVIALEYAFPILGVMLLLTVGMVLLGRAVPQLNLMEFSFAARVLLALGAATWFLADGTPFLLDSFRFFLDGATTLFVAR